MHITQILHRSSPRNFGIPRLLQFDESRGAECAKITVTVPCSVNEYKYQGLSFLKSCNYLLLHFTTVTHGHVVQVASYRLHMASALVEMWTHVNFVFQYRGDHPLAAPHSTLYNTQSIYSTFTPTDQLQHMQEPTCVIAFEFETLKFTIHDYLLTCILQLLYSFSLRSVEQ